ncbi:MAG: S8 family serine peptidase [Paracoccus sp. (in: a-proteobacteria)]|uniref:S8 family serine peptidase n=1 Tax=Paracoccus sp. TaxID=267 RepID=UPI0026E001E5|nr:S8 family serine peptidase [Paracoccus sp. (in: a-proteobacteria)]MDO5621491.1 S8 family serine peptidase [Paracoccus sp. (in: a-proteobacteria)]
MLSRLFGRIVLVFVVFTLAVASDWRLDQGYAVSAAWADDDDDDDDDDDRSGDRNDVQRLIRRVQPQRTVRQPARTVRQPARTVRRAAAPSRPAPPPPQYAPDEVIARDLTPEALAALETEGFSPLRQVSLSGGGQVHRLRKPRALALEAARDRVRQAGGDAGVRADFNHYYRAESAAACKGADCPARQMIDWPATCNAPGVRVGMIDSGLNSDHAALKGANLTLHKLETDAQPSGAIHGTAVASLLVGASDTRSPGLVPGVSLFAVDAFHRGGQDERADAFALVEALDWLQTQQVQVVNLSLAGPDNLLLADKVAALNEAGVAMIAAGGNGGPKAPPVYPAAYGPVIGVTAVDRRGEVYRRANRGAHIDIAAPGVDVWTAASISGARTKTGTSFAAPFVTAAAAVMLADDATLTPAALRHKLRQNARDLGTEGRDDVFGHGLLTPPEGCAGDVSGAAETVEQAEATAEAP